MGTLLLLDEGTNVPLELNALIAIEAAAVFAEDLGGLLWVDDSDPIVGREHGQLP